MNKEKLQDADRNYRGHSLKFRLDENGEQEMEKMSDLELEIIISEFTNLFETGSPQPTDVVDWFLGHDRIRTIGSAIRTYWNRPHVAPRIVDNINALRGLSNTSILKLSQAMGRHPTQVRYAVKAEQMGGHYVFCPPIELLKMAKVLKTSLARILFADLRAAIENALLFGSDLPNPKEPPA